MTNLRHPDWTPVNHLTNSQIATALGLYSAKRHRGRSCSPKRVKMRRSPPKMRKSTPLRLLRTFVLPEITAIDLAGWHRRNRGQPNALRFAEGSTLPYRSDIDADHALDRP
jgi:hypothetical protein